MRFLMKIKFTLDDLAAVFSKHKRVRARGKLIYYYFLFGWRERFRPKRRHEAFFGITLEFQNYPLFYGLWKEMFIVENYCLPRFGHDPKIVDVGSNIGLSIAYFKYVYPNAKIIAFEPGRENLVMLRHNIEANGWTSVDVHGAAASDHDGEITIYESADHSEGNSIWKELTQEGRAIQVPCEALSPFLKATDVLKLDIEGSEYAVMRAADLSEVKWIFMEVHQRAHPMNDGLHEILEKLADSGFKYSLSGGQRQSNFITEYDSSYNLMAFARKMDS
jgi:FkbM family methyltransferase